VLVTLQLVASELTFTSGIETAPNDSVVSSIGQRQCPDRAVYQCY